MAGIGFQLKKLYSKSGLFQNIRAYSYSSIVTVGPMAICICLILFSKLIMESVGASVEETELFMAGTMYAFIFSQMITNGFAYVISRFVADQTFLKKEDNVLSSMYGLISICVMIGAIAGCLFYWSSPLPLLFKLATYSFFVELIIIWIQSMYVSALKDYMKIVKSFLIGIAVAVGLIVFCLFTLKWMTATALFLCLDIGFFVIILLFTNYIRAYFHIDNQKYFLFLIYIEKYPLLLFSGMFFSIGLYGHHFVIWQSEYQEMIGETFYYAPYYDVPVFFAILTILPATVLFMVSVETTFYEAYKRYYHRILHSFSFRDISTAKDRLFKVVSLELTLVAEVQLFVIFFAFTLGVQLLPTIGMTADQVHIFTMLTLGNLFFSLMQIILLILLYFDYQKGAFFTSSLFAISVVVFSILGMRFGFYGLPVFLGAFVALCVAIFSLMRYLTNIDYYTYCSQPVVYVEKKTKTEGLLKRLKHL
ncbi:exopolysaccharide Pel transporter PelG [Aquibacillus albus]|uniref:Membrane protein n=1 Tax=Aquibacillus albus TaxID=1168171 RepID=A0ABS2MVU2_9BACI|nr:exopolysaccharide Pel transporter PelG [Aquibacillus albus]MBM7570002.1 putative membrane protein [Aquibacillus albus]